ncbi:MDR family MFS transporter [Demequina zhanjiangensis]|uniref:MDR family MFS transporter n=1 Tax=Demequina zhanjiangensis TaxID=3051659 RepID=A0ABT8FZW2_9MICO|nr:MDR family MFS transporter [Demequina sp. SYSU T00b26]MDN4472431.1 MDR family MFS transporter [Demequina sp. SYSU T00b26]
MTEPTSRTAVDTDVIDDVPAFDAAATARRNTTVIWMLIVAAFTVILNETIMGVAIPHLMTDLGISASDAQWLTTAFLLTMAVVIPTTGFLLQKYPTRGLYLVAMGLFTAGTVLGAIAPGFEVLLVARVIQASGTAIMFPLLMTTVMELEPPATRGRRMGSIAVVISVAPAIGPTVSGLVLSVASWRFLFVAVLPVAITVLVLGFLRMKTVNEPSHARIDLLSVPLSAVAFGGIVFGLSRLGESAGEDHTLAYASFAVGLVALALFGWRQLLLQREDRALLDLRTFKTRTFSLAVVMFAAAMMSLFGAIILLPLYTQGVLGMTVLASGLMLLPGGLVSGLMAPFVGRLYDRIGPRPLLIPGTILVSSAMLLMALSARVDGQWWEMLASHVVMSMGLALTFTPLFSASLGSLPGKLYSHGSATVSTLQQVAAAAGTALFISVMTALTVSGMADGSMSAEAAQASGIQAAFFIASGIAAIGAVLAFFVQRPETSEDAPAPVGH